MLFSLLHTKPKTRNPFYIDDKLAEGGGQGWGEYEFEVKRLIFPWYVVKKKKLHRKVGGYSFGIPLLLSYGFLEML